MQEDNERLMASPVASHDARRPAELKSIGLFASESARQFGWNSKMKRRSGGAGGVGLHRLGFVMRKKPLDGLVHVGG